MPFTPREAVGIPAGTATGPYILLFPNGNVDSELQSVALTGPGGEVVPVKVVRPDAPAPSAPAGWPRRNSVSSGPYVIPVAPLMPLTAYVLTAQWELDEAGLHVQTVRFTTGRDASGCPPDVCLRGKLAFRTSGRRLSISVTPAVGQRIQVEMRRGKRMCATRQRGRCPKRNRWFLGYSSTQRSLRLRGARATVRLPPRVRGLNALWISVRLDGPFTAQGRKWLGAHVTATDFHAR